MKPFESVGRWYPVVFIVAAMAIGAIGLGHLRRAIASKSWPTATGQVIDTENRRSRNPSRRSTSSQPRQLSQYAAIVVYEFEVDGEMYSADRIKFIDLSSSDRDRAEAILSRHPGGSQVTVSYNPDNPSEAVLQPGLHASTWLLPGGAVAFLVAGLLVFRQNWRAWDRWKARTGSS